MSRSGRRQTARLRRAYERGRFGGAFSVLRVADVLFPRCARARRCGVRVLWRGLPTTLHFTPRLLALTVVGCGGVERQHPAPLSFQASVL